MSHLHPYTLIPRLISWFIFFTSLCIAENTQCVSLRKPVLLPRHPYCPTSAWDDLGSGQFPVTDSMQTKAKWPSRKNVPEMIQALNKSLSYRVLNIPFAFINL